MNSPNLTKFFKNVQNTLVKHTPEILTGIGIAGMVTTTVLAVKATPKAMILLEEKAEEERCAVRDLTVPETVKTCWKCYIPAAVTGVASIACLIGASSVNLRRNAMLATAYKLSETALTEYQDKVVETIGEKKEKVVREKVAEEQIKKNPVTKSEVIITGKGDSLCFDPLSARYFNCDIELIRRAENALNKKMLYDMGGAVSINEFYDEIGLPHTELGEVMGWNADELIDLDITSHVTDDGRPSLVIGHYNAPKYEFY